MITNNRNDSLKAIVSSFNLLPNLARDFKTIRRSLSKITGIKPSITEDSKTKDGKGISPTLVGADDKKKSEGGGLLNPLLLLKLASFGQKKKFLRSPVGKAFRKFRKVSKSIKSIQKTLLNVVKKVFSPKNIIKILSKLALPLVIVGSLFEGLTAGFDAYKETGSIWEAYKATVGGVVEFLTFGLIDKEMVGKFYQGIADFIKPVTDAIGKIYASIKEYVGEKVDGVKTFFGMKVEPKVTKPVIEQPSKEELEKQAKAQEEIEKAKEEERKKQYEGEDEIVRKRLKLQEKSAKKLQEEEDERRAKEGKPTPAPAPAPAPAAAAPAAAPAAAAPAAAPAKAPSKDEKPLAASTGEPLVKKISPEAGKKAMLDEMDNQKVSDPTTRAAIMAQAAKETGGFALLSEDLRYSVGGLQKTFQRLKNTSEDDLKAAIKGGSGGIGELIYGGSKDSPSYAFGVKNLGNTEPGDGVRFRGRGFFQLTGRANYKKAGALNSPEKLLEMGEAAKTAVDFALRYKGDFGDVTAFTKYVNGGSIGLKERGEYFNAYLNDPAITKIGAASSTQSGGNVASASTDVASGQRQQAKPSTPVNINASTTNNTKINKNEMAAASKPRDTAGMLAARAA
jgi:predicted chitinase